MTISRRALLSSAAAVAAMPAAGAAEWPAEWDRAILKLTLQAGAARYDPVEQMVTSQRGPEYQYHTNLRSARVHPTRDSLEYALVLLEGGGPTNLERARAVIERVIALQDKDPASRWYGIWGWYLEEPPPRMSPADWNWADFNGATLLMIESRHSAVLGDQLREQVRETIHHAAYSVRRRNVSMTYTNIAVKGTFVTLAAAELLKDADLAAYARERLVRLCKTIDETGSFAEYNSPTYAKVTITNLTRIQMLVHDPTALASAARLHERAWLHLASHWDVARAQLAGPQARAYSTDIGKPAWIEKALGGRLGLVTPPGFPADADTAVHNYRCPPQPADLFLKARPGVQHREIFLPGAAGVRPVQGTTFLAADFSLGTINRGDLWVQRRPLLTYWGSGKQWMCLRVIKDDYDFSSATLYTVQDRGRVLGLINFRSPGGDKHISLDPIVEGQFPAKRLRALFEITGLPPELPVFHDERRILVQLGSGVRAWIAWRGRRFGSHTPRVSVGPNGPALDFLPPAHSGTVRWDDVPAAWALFTLAIVGADQSREELDRSMLAAHYEESAGNGVVHASWLGMELSGSVRVAPISEQDQKYAEKLNGAAVPLVRLSDDKLAPA